MITKLEIYPLEIILEPLKTNKQHHNSSETLINPILSGAIISNIDRVIKIIDYYNLRFIQIKSTFVTVTTKQEY